MNRTKFYFLWKNPTHGCLIAINRAYMSANDTDESFLPLPDYHLYEKNCAGKLIEILPHTYYWCQEDYEIHKKHCSGKIIKILNYGENRIYYCRDKLVEILPQMYYSCLADYELHQKDCSGKLIQILDNRVKRMYYCVPELSSNVEKR